VDTNADGVLEGKELAGLLLHPYQPPPYGFGIPRFADSLDERMVRMAPGSGQRYCDPSEKKRPYACKIEGTCLGLGPARKDYFYRMDFIDDCVMGSCCQERLCLQRARDFFHYCGNALMPVGLVEAVKRGQGAITATWMPTNASAVFELGDVLLFARHELWPASALAWHRVFDSRHPPANATEAIPTSKPLRALAMAPGEGEVPVWLARNFGVASISLLPLPPAQPLRPQSAPGTPPGTTHTHTHTHTAEVPELSPAQRLRQALAPSWLEGLTLLSLGCSSSSSSSSASTSSSREPHDEQLRSAVETYVDGGCYALADVGLDKIEAVISLGIGSNVAFERELSALLRGRHGRDVPVLAYDPYPGNFSLDHVVTVPSMQV